MFFICNPLKIRKIQKLSPENSHRRIGFFTLAKTLFMKLFLRALSALVMPLYLLPLCAQSQPDSSTFIVSMEYRPRTELRNGYRQLPALEAATAFLTSHRARINLNYEFRNFRIYSSLQDIRVWGSEDTRDATGDAQFAQFFVEPQLTDHLKIRVGRQQIAFDDQRLFALNNWRQAGGRHDAVRLMYKNKKVNSDLVVAFNQNKARNFSTLYDVSFDFYKFLLVNHLAWQLSDQFKIMTINFADGYQDAPNSASTRFKFTNGGKLTYKSAFFTLNFSAYYQHGRIESGETIRAYLVEPELRFSVNPRHQVQLGLQVFSGDDDPNDGISRAFMAQYGAFHKFNGRMDYTERTVRTYNHEGIFNPYLIQDFKLGKKTGLIWESHLLGTTTPIVGNKVVYESSQQIYAWENDLRFRYKPNAYTNIEMAYLFMLAKEQLQFLPAGLGGDATVVPQFAYIEITWTPELFRHRQRLP